MSTPRKDGALTLADSSFPWLGEDGGYRVVGADSILWAHWLYGLKEEAYDRLGRDNLRRIKRYCKKNNISFTHGMVKIKRIKKHLDFFEGSAEVESRSKGIKPVYDVDFGFVIKRADKTRIRNRSLRRIYVDCGCPRAKSLLGIPVKEEVRKMYNDKRDPSKCTVNVSLCYHSIFLLYELVTHNNIDGYDQIGLDSQTDLFAKHELRYLLKPSPKPFEINNFLLKTNFFNPLRKILGIPLVV